MDNLLLLGHNVIHCSFRYIEDCLTKQEALEILQRNEKFKAEREEKVRVSGKNLFSKFSKLYFINNLAYFVYDADKNFRASSIHHSSWMVGIFRGENCQLESKVHV